MKFRFLLSLILMGSLTIINAQTIDEIKSEIADKTSEAADYSAKAGAVQSEINALKGQLDKLVGWRTGLNGMLGFNWNKSNGWISNPNPDASSSSLNIGLNAHAMMDKEKIFWHNKGFITKSWSDVDLSSGDASGDDDNLFDNGTVDIFNLSSLGGYKLNDKFALSGLSELNTSVENFLNPGTFDIGVGATWLPIQNMTVVLHPFNYHIAFSGVDGISSSGAFGGKLRIDYFQDFNVSGKSIKWTTTLTSFIPYSNKTQLIPLPDGTEFEAGLFEYTWLNTLSFEVWKGIGVGLGWGIRNSEFESTSTQSYTSVGVSYGF